MMGKYKKNIIQLVLITGVVLLFYRFSNLIKPQPENIYHLEKIKSLIKTGDSLRKKGEYEKAIESFDRAYWLSRENRDAIREIYCLKSLGLMYWNIGKIEKSFLYHKNTVQRAQKIKQNTLEEKQRKILKIINFLREGISYRQQNMYQESIRKIEKALQLSEEIKSPEHEVKCLRLLSFSYWKLNDENKFYSLNKKALELARRISNTREQSKCLVNVGLSYWKFNNYSRALNCYERALSIARHLGNKEDESACLNNIGIIYENIGFYDRSLEYLKKALSIDMSLGDDEFISIYLNNIGETLRSRGNFSGNRKDLLKALKNFKRSLMLAEKNGDEKTENEVLNNLGQVCFDLGRYDKALKYLKSVNRGEEAFKNIRTECMIMNNMGTIFLKLGKYTLAEQYFKKGLNFLEKLKSEEIFWESYFGLGQCFENRKEYKKAVFFYNKSIAVIENVREKIFLDLYKAGFLRNKIKVYEHLINLLYKLYEKSPSFDLEKEIFYAVERAKARAFVEHMEEDKHYFKELDPWLKKREQSLSRSISTLMIKLSGSNLSKEKKTWIEQRLHQKEEEYLSLMSQIREKKSDIGDFSPPKPCRYEQIQKDHLDNRTAIIEFFIGEENVFLFLLTKEELSLHRLASWKGIKNSVRNYLKILSSSPKKEFMGMCAGKHLFHELFSPIFEQIKGKKDYLVIVPDGILHCLPFEALVWRFDKKSGKGNFLISEFNISYAPSISALISIRKKSSEYEQSKKILALGNPLYCSPKRSKGDKKILKVDILREFYLSQGFDFSPLPCSEKEVLEISSVFPEYKKDIYLKEEAKEEIVKKKSYKDYQIIHFACHGFVDEVHPFRSALVLSLDDDPEEDGFLQVREIYNLCFKADLIVLSACQTAGGQLERNEGVFGFSRSLFYSGAKSVVSTLWNINDESTAIFMKSFYTYLSQKRDKAQAIRLAKIDLLETKYRHPFYWAAFILKGEYSSGVMY
ncbi:MAG: CHAT domain-containing protein [Candidatus Aminicenantaceae bacterium]